MFFYNKQTITLARYVPYMKVPTLLYKINSR